MRRRRMHGHLRRRSSCKPSPLKHKKGEGWAHDFKTDDEYHKNDSGITEATADPKKAATEDTKFETIPQEYSTMDKVQDALSVAGMSPGYGIAADGVNFLISGVRGIGSLLSGDLESAKKHGIQAGFSAGGAIPVAGQYITSVNLGRRAKAIADTAGMLGNTKAGKVVSAVDAGEGAVNIVKGGK